MQQSSDELATLTRRVALRRMTVVGVGVVGCTLLAACGGGTLPPAAAPAPTAASGPLEGAQPTTAAPTQAGTAQVKLQFWTFENPQQRPYMKDRIDRFVQQHPNVSVDFQYFQVADLSKKIAVALGTGTAPEVFATGDWSVPTWLAKNTAAPIDPQQIGYKSVDEFRADYPDRLMQSLTKDGKIYAYPFQVYGYLNYLNTKFFTEAGLDAEKDYPKTWDDLGQVAQKLAVKDGGKFTRQGFKFAMHAATWTMFQFNPILLQHGGQWFDDQGKSTINNAAGLKAMTVRASITRQYKAEDPADSIATPALPQMDWIKERDAMFFSHPLPPAAIQSENPTMAEQKYYMPVQYPGVEPGKGYSTTYGWVFMLNATNSPDKMEVGHSLLKYVNGDPVDLFQKTAPFPPARKSGWLDDPLVKDFPFIKDVVTARDNGVSLPRSITYDEVADIMHRAVQKVMLNNADIQATLDQAAAEIDQATATAKS